MGAEIKNVEYFEEYIKKTGIPVNKELEQIVPRQFHEIINQVIIDYDIMKDEEFIKKYHLDDVWYTVEEYAKEKIKSGLLGKVIVNVLVEKGYILQIDYKENGESVVDNIENFWDDQKVKLVTFDLDTDQYYCAYIPEKCILKSVYEVNVLDYN